MAEMIVGTRRLGMILLSGVLLAVGAVFYGTYEAEAVQLHKVPESDKITKISSHTSDNNQTVATSDDNLVTAEGMFFEKTAIIKFTNNSDIVIESFTLWLDGDNSFESFKTERWWTGKKTPQGTIILTGSEPLKYNESVKLGIKTDSVDSKINWIAIDKDGNEIKVGKTSANSPQVPNPVPELDPDPTPVPVQPDDGINPDSTFRIIPEKPNVGDTIRVIGEGFGALQQFNFYIGVKELGTFQTDENGRFITTMKIPGEEQADRVNFRVTDKDGGEMQVSLRLGANENKVPKTNDVKLDVRGMPTVLHRGDALGIAGTAIPGGTIVISVKDPEGNEILTRTAVADVNGNWSLSSVEIVPLDAEFGTYSAEISDGRNNILKMLEIQSSKIIIITPSSLNVDPGETVKFAGTALPNIPVEFILEDPLGQMVASEIRRADNSGSVMFEYETSNSSTKGTYTLIITQGENKEFVFVGLGHLPEIPVKLEFDRLNYRSNELATISLVGEASDIVSLLIIDPSGRAVPLVKSNNTGGGGGIILDRGNSNSDVGTIFLKMGPDGRGTHYLDLDRYSSGAYTAVISKGNTKSSEIFTVGLDTGRDIKQISTTKQEYKPDEVILILGNASPNTLVSLILIDPDDSKVRSKNTLSHEDGRISESSFKVPSDAVQGVWTIKAESGSNYAETTFNVIPTEEVMRISVDDEGTKVSGVGKTIQILVTGATKHQTVTIEIIAPDGNVITKTEFPATEEGVVNQPWIIPKDAEPGTYTIEVTQAKNTAQTSYTIMQ